MCGTLITRTITGVHYKESKQAGIHQSFTCQKFLTGSSPKFASTKRMHYMVQCPLLTSQVTL